MAYLGNAPARSFISFERQVFTIVNSQTAYALSHSVTNENDIRLVVNNVVQEPGSGKAYTATGTALTLSAALTNGTDEMYCVFLGRATATSAPGAGSIGTAQLAADAVTNSKIADDAISDEQLDPTVITGQTAETSVDPNDTILIHDTSASALRKMTRANFVSGLEGANTPSFRAYSASAQNLTNNTALKIVFGTEDFDTNSDFASSRFTPTVAGTYFVFSQIVISNDSVAEALKYGVNIMKKNTSELVRNTVDAKNSSPSNQSANYVATLVAMNGSSDYIEVFGQADASAGNAQVGNGSNQTYFGAFKLIT